MRRRIYTIATALLFILTANAQSITKTTAPGASNSLYTVNQKVSTLSTAYTSAVATMSDGDTLYVGSKSDTLYVEDDNSSLMNIDIILMIVDSGVAHWTDRADWVLSDSSQLIMYNGGDLSSPLPCDANKKLVFGTYNVASCSGGNADFSFRDIIDMGGFDPQNPPLPVSLTDFNATQLDELNINVNWQTAMEINHERFEILRSTDGVNFTVVHTEFGSGVNSLEIKNYNFVDQFNNTNGVYYKLVQYDFDGQNEAFNVVYVAPSKTTTVRTYPNPATSYLTVDINSENPSTEITLSNLKGQVLFAYSTTRNESVTIDLNDFETGLYILSVDGQNQKILKK